MNDVAQVAAVIGAVAYLGAAPLEMFFYDRPWARRFLGVETHDIEDVRLWSFCIGARNVLAAGGIFVGLWIHHQRDAVVGEAVFVTTLWYMLLASLAMGLCDLLGYWRPRGGSIPGTIGSSLFPAIALVALAV